MFCSLSHSEALEKMINIVYEQLQIKLKQGEDSSGRKGLRITWVLSTLVCLVPFAARTRLEMSFTLVSDILSSSFSEGQRHFMASNMVQLLGNHFFPKKDSNIPDSRFSMEPTWIPPLLGFLSLSEKFYATRSPPHAGSIALCILSAAHIPPDFSTTILTILSSTLLPTHPLQSRHLALKLFNQLLPWLLSSQMEDVPGGGLKNLLQAVSDPFLFTEDTSLLDQQTQLWETDYKPVYAAVALIELASSDLWQNHLDPSNFTTCENFLSTEEGENAAIVYMLNGQFTPELPYMATKVVATVGRLEELQCLNTAEVVIMWAWTIGVLDAEDHDAWESIESSTRLFHQTHGMERLKALERHITSKSLRHSYFFQECYEGPLCRAARV